MAAVANRRLEAVERWLTRHHASRPTFRLGEVARLLNVTPQAIAMAEREGRIPRIAREVGGDDRLFFPEDLARIRALFQR